MGVLVVIPFLLLLSPALQSRMAIIDDHEIVSRHQSAQSPPSLASALVHAVRADAELGRFRPVYRAVREVQMRTLGRDPFRWHLVMLLLGAATGAAVYASFRLMGLGPTEATVGAYLSAFAPGAASLWVRLGPAEGWGTFLLAVGLVFLALSRTKRGSSGFDWLLLACLTLAGLAKESYTLAMPAMVLARIAIAADHSSTGLRAVLRERRAFLILSLLLFGLLMTAAWRVAVFAGPQSYGGISLSRFPTAGGVLLPLRTHPEHSLLPLLALALTYRSADELNWRRALGAFAFLLLGCGPQVLVYASRGGLVEHYWYPYAFVAGIASAAAVWVLRQPSVPRPGRLAALLLAAAFIARGARANCGYAATFRADTLAFQDMLEYVRSRAPRHAPVAILADPNWRYEHVVSVMKYLRSDGRGDLRFSLVPVAGHGQSGWLPTALGRQLIHRHFAGKLCRSLSAGFAVVVCLPLAREDLGAVTAAYRILRFPSRPRSLPGFLRRGAVAPCYTLLVPADGLTSRGGHRQTARLPAPHSPVRK